MFRPRFVSTALRDGVAVVRKDGPADNAFMLPFGHFIADGWRIDGVPRNVADGSDVTNQSLSGLPGTAVFRICQIAPDEEVISRLPAMREQFGDSFLGASLGQSDFGMHTTPTIDFVTVIEGEIDMHLDGGEVVKLAAGDSVIQRGTAHAWRNTSGKPARFAAVVISVGEPE